MGPEIEDELGGESTRDEESLESLLRTTDRDTEAVVEALREGGARTHVSESSVDDIIAEFSRPQSDESEGAFALSGGPTRTVSTTGIDEVFETLEAQAPPLPPEPETGSTTESDTTDGSSVTGSDDPPTVPETSPSTTGLGTIDRRRAPRGERFDTAVEAVSDDDGDGSDSFGTLAGGEPTRTVSESSVDDILALVDDEPDSATEASKSDDAADLRPDDPEGELVALLTGDEPTPAPTTDGSVHATDSARDRDSARRHTADNEGGDASDAEESSADGASDGDDDDTADASTRSERSFDDSSSHSWDISNFSVVTRRR